MEAVSRMKEKTKYNYNKQETSLLSQHKAR